MSKKKPYSRYRKKGVAYKRKRVFMQDNATSHAARFTIQSLAKLGIKNEQIMVWLPSSPDLEPKENIWSVLKKKIYVEARQFAFKDQLWFAIITAATDIEPDDIKNPTSSMDDRFLEVI